MELKLNKKLKRFKETYYDNWFCRNFFLTTKFLSPLLNFKSTIVTHSNFNYHNYISLDIVYCNCRFQGK